MAWFSKDISNICTLWIFSHQIIYILDLHHKYVNNFLFSTSLLNACCKQKCWQRGTWWNNNWATFFIHILMKCKQKHDTQYTVYLNFEFTRGKLSSSCHFFMLVWNAEGRSPQVLLDVVYYLFFSAELPLYTITNRSLFSIHSMENPLEQQF